MLRSKLHLIATMRVKMDYVVETNDKGKSVPRKVGLAPVQREAMDYEFDIVFDIDLNHNMMSTKDRSSMFDGKMISRPDEEVGKGIAAWLKRGTSPADPKINDRVPRPVSAVPLPRPAEQRAAIAAPRPPAPADSRLVGRSPLLGERRNPAI